MQQIAIENLFLIDIETVSGVPNFHLLNDEWKELWTEKILKNLPSDTTAEDYYPKRAAILAEFAKVVCISTGYFKKENNEWQLRIKSFYSENEKASVWKVLQKCWNNYIQKIQSGFLPATTLKNLISLF